MLLAPVINIRIDIREIPTCPGPGHWFFNPINSNMVYYAEISIFALTLTAGFVIRWIKNRKEAHSLLKRLGYKGPEPELLAGNLNQLRSVANPNEILDKWIDEYGNVFGYYLGEKPHIVLNDLELLKEAFVTQAKKFRDRPRPFLEVEPLIYSVVFLNVSTILPTVQVA